MLSVLDNVRQLLINIIKVCDEWDVVASIQTRRPTVDNSQCCLAVDIDRFHKTDLVSLAVG